jgi:hypothetical protein
MFPVHGVTCLLPKAVHKRVKKLAKRFAVDEEVEMGGAEVGETTVKRLLCCGFRRAGIYVGGRYVEKQMFFPGSNITFFTVYIHLEATLVVQWLAYWPRVLQVPGSTPTIVISNFLITI